MIIYQVSKLFINIEVACVGILATINYISRTGLEKEMMSVVSHHFLDRHFMDHRKLAVNQVRIRVPFVLHC